MTTIVTRAGKGSPLTNAEVDQNFLNLNADKLEAGDLSPYLLSATAAATYQTIAGMSSYLTTANAASTYLTQANAASTYLTQSNAASTYQTQAGMSSYLTSAAASSTYAPLASPTLTGTPAAPTAAADTNTTQIATTAFVIGQGYLKSATAASTYLTQANAASTYQTQSGMANYLLEADAALIYQPILISGTNLKTINGTSLLGGGDLTITAGVSSFNTRTGAITLTSGDVTTALGFTPYNATNPSGYVDQAGARGAISVTQNLSYNSTTGVITGPDLSAYLTSATAASTYQTQAGMSSYLTSATAASTYLALAGGTLTGNLGFSGTGLRITGDFTNATTASRLMVQTSTANGQTFFGLIPNGTAVNTQFQAFNAADPANASVGSFVAASGTVRIVSGNTGTGTLLPIVFVFNSTEAARFATNGNLLLGTTTDNATDRLQVNGTIKSLTGGFVFPDGTTQTTAATGGGTPGGLNTQIQFNNSGAFGGTSNVTWNGTNLFASKLGVGQPTTPVGSWIWDGNGSLIDIYSSDGSVASEVAVRSGGTTGGMFAQGGSSEWGLYGADSSTFALYTNGFQRLAVDSSGAFKIVNASLLVGVSTSDGVSAVQVAGKIKSTTGGFVFPDGTTQTTAATGGGGGGITTGKAIAMAIVFGG